MNAKVTYTKIKLNNNKNTNSNAKTTNIKIKYSEGKESGLDIDKFDKKEVRIFNN